MGIEDDINCIKINLVFINNRLVILENKLDKLLAKEQPHNRQDKEKAIKNTLDLELAQAIAKKGTS